MSGIVQLRITEADHEANAFWDLGLVTHEVAPRVLFESLPDNLCGNPPNHEGSCYLADLLDEAGDLWETKEISPELAQTLLDEPIATLRERFRQHLWETCGAVG